MIALAEAAPPAGDLLRVVTSRRRVLRIADDLEIRVLDRYGPADAIRREVATAAKPVELLELLTVREWMALAAEIDPELRDRGRADRNVRAEVLALARLPEDLRRAVELVELDGVPATEAADRLGLKLATLRTRVHRGLVRLCELAGVQPARKRRLPILDEDPFAQLGAARARMRRGGRQRQPERPSRGRVLTVLQSTPPRTRGDCEGGYRPCPWISCRYHLGEPYSEGHKGTRRRSGETCVLDLAAQGGMKLAAIGDELGVTRERARQLIESGLRRIAPEDLQVLTDLVDASRDAERAWT